MYKFKRVIIADIGLKYHHIAYAYNNNFSNIFFIDHQDKEIDEGTTKTYSCLSSGCFSVIVLFRAYTCFFFSSLFAGVPPAKRPKLSQDECNRLAPTVEMLGDLSQEITSFWKDLGIKLKVPYEKIKEIQDDNVPYPGVKDKAFQMLMVWKEQSSDVAKIMELSGALKDLGKNRTEMKYCSGSSFMDDTAI